MSNDQHDRDDAARDATHAMTLKMLEESGAQAVAAVSIGSTSEDAASVVLAPGVPDRDVDGLITRLAAQLEAAARHLRHQLFRRRQARDDGSN